MIEELYTLLDLIDVKAMHPDNLHSFYKLAQLITQYIEADAETRDSIKIAIKGIVGEIDA